MSKSNCSRLWLRQFAGFMAVLIAAPAALGQTKTSGILPDDLKPSLEARLAQFIQAQADGNWNSVGSMLGRYRMGGVGHHPLTPESKACLVMQMKEMPMIAFKMKDYTFSTEILSLPLDKRSWNLVGEAVFRSTTGERATQSQVTAYRDKGEWFFSPPNYDEFWEKSHLTEADFDVDRADEIEIENTQNAPLEIFEVHAFLDKKYLSLLDVSFKLKNQTTKKVSAFTVRFYTETGSVEYSTGAAMDPGADVEGKEHLSRYPYFCDGVAKNKFVVTSVSFADGTEWNRTTRR
jgi:hypothetical protein